MSNNHRNYNAMSNKSTEPTQYKPKEETLVEDGNVVNDTPSYNVQEPTTTPAVNEPEAPEEPLYGVVANCAKLNVRKDPDKNSEVIAVIENGTEVVIVPSKSTSDWYYIALWEGYVMKDYIIIK